jgi:RNA polymerase sigma-70 factor (ECF subfamily)
MPVHDRSREREPAPLDESTRARVLAELAGARATWLAFVQRRISDTTIAEDIVQDVLARAAQKLDTLQDPEAAQAWFYRSLRNAIADHYRRGGAAERALERLAPELEHSEQPELANNPCACVGEVMDRLQPNYEHALRRVHAEGVSLEDYAAEVGITRGNAAVRVHRARKALHGQLSECCGKCADAGCIDCTCHHPSPE